MTADHERRLQRAAGRTIEVRRIALTGAVGRMPSMADLFGRREQRLDQAAARLASGLSAHVAAHDRRLAAVAARLTPQVLTRPIDRQAERLEALDRRATQALRQELRARERQLETLGRRLPSLDRPIRQATGRLDELEGRARRALDRLSGRQAERLDRVGRLLVSLDPKGPMDRGFALVTRSDGSLVRSAASLSAGEALSLQFRHDAAAVTVDGEGAPPRPAPAKSRPKPPPAGQGDLF